MIWRLFDGRAGHENQVRGLSDAMARLYPCRNVDICISAAIRGCRSLLPGRMEFCRDFPKPDLLVAAGHGTHWPLIRLQRRFGGRSVVIMRPGLPSSFFDLCVVPAHDRWVQGPRVIVTEGALNRIRPEHHRRAECGAFLIGGPSRHFQWSDTLVLSKISDVVTRSELPYILMTSQRTPSSFHVALRESGLHLRVRSADAVFGTSPNEVLSICREAWVSCDSVSMIYEAITSGCRVGLLELPAGRPGRLSQNVDRLCQRGLATSWTSWRNGRPLVSQSHFCEADRVAAMLLEAMNLAPTQGFDVTPESDTPSECHEKNIA
ncbi:MAG: mitochondrial fission ELM1 family protein [Planctomycetota bacterium]